VAKLYANENFPQPVIEALRELGHDVLTTLESGKSGQAIPDEAVLAFAVETVRVLVTFNRKHFIRLHNDKPDHTGIIVCTVDSNFSALAERIHQAMKIEPELRGKLIRINRPNP
jgi:hypothetical protein